MLFALLELCEHNNNNNLPQVPSKQKSTMASTSVNLDGHPWKEHSNGHTNGHAPDMDTLIQKLSKHGNPALHVTPEHTIALKDTKIPVPSPTEALIHVRCTGICGSDMHLWHAGAIGPLAVDRECILGHEPSGVVLAVGSEVTNVSPGDKVAIEPGVPCRKCWLCEAGQYNLCEFVEFSGVCPYAGSIRRFMAHDARMCHKLPDSLTFSQGALLEPLSVILHAVKQCGGALSIGKPALICGAGPIGLIALAAAKASGAWPLVITDVDQSRLEFASTFVPGVKTYHVKMGKSSIECSEEIRAIYGCKPRNVEKGTPSPNEYVAPPCVLECTGIESSVATAAYSCRRNGLVMVVGVGKSIMNNLPFMQLSYGEIDLKFINRYHDTWPAAINALTNSQVMNLDALVTQTFKLEEAVKAMELCSDKNVASVKVQIVDDIDLGL